MGNLFHTQVFRGGIFTNPVVYFASSISGD